MERIGIEVERELARGGARDALPLAAVTRAWPAAVGETVARNAWPARMARDGTLLVNTSSSTWAFELDRLAEAVSESLRASLGESAPTRLRFAVGPVPEPDRRERSADRPPIAGVASPEVERQAAEVAAAIDDPDLREMVARAARASLARESSDRRF
jgi:hypothetical protein